MSNLITGVDKEESTRSSKKKLAIIFGYVGSQFSGLQLNDGVRTVEQVLEEALHKTGCIADHNHEGGLQKVQWTRSSRTDKGVHAAVNVISLKSLRSNDDSLCDDLRKRMPDDVRVFGCLRVTKSFHSKLMTTSREYEYVLPGFVLHRLSEEQRTNLKTNVEDLGNIVSIFDNSLPLEIEIDRFNTILASFVGTQNYHNFTSGTSSFDSSAKRYITKFRADIIDGTIVRILIHGQAFLYNQIRKMIGTCLAIYHGALDYCHLQDGFLFHSTKLFKLPLAPATGLFLQRPLFRDYNLKVAGRDDLKLLDFADFESDISDFVSTRIYKEIISRDRSTHEFAKWIVDTLLNTSTDWNSWKQVDPPTGDALQAKKKRKTYRTNWN